MVENQMVCKKPNGSFNQTDPRFVPAVVIRREIHPSHLTPW